MDGHWFKREFPSESADTNAPPFADIFLIDTEALDATEAHVSQYPDKKLGEEEMAWLQEQLKESRARWKIVAAHHPLYSDGEHGHDKQVLDLRARLDPLFRQWKVDAFITGHDHDLQRLEVPGNPTLFLVSGAGSKTRPGFDGEWKPFHAAVNGFAAIKLTDTEMRGEFLDADGKVLDAWHRPPLSATGK
jgi:acid phosphatase